MSAASSRGSHPNNAPGVPMLIPPAVERFQIKYINPLMKPFAKRMPGFTVIKHRGRTSGTPYETVVTSFRKGNTLAVGLAHGKTNWVKNVLAAGEADVHLFSGDVHITNPRVLPAGTDDPNLPGIARIAGRRIGVFVADIV
ncbi:nitroreductase family deazaflavin-dependent oxidoreductase [Mycolicibacterium mageritense]|nr:nitroreductase family deazaflavin-dependent oxidoreductase [Mycolicibacterium mageritense]TXI51854.1 MAG: nitroreductase family deazaflavin-dependent oxidoreductase [Mycolicibacterium mageritense]CDO26581.1 deazaflavin-dependent nitroreductase family protein [Mycolicibacterium mageritense DSM 44476 = CIP 104973]